MQSQAESDHLNRKLTGNFLAREFICPCCVAEGIKEEVVIRLQIAHENLKPFSVMIITSGYRCEKYNDLKGSRKTSSHVKGYAVDIKCDNSPYRYELLEALLRAGFTRLGIGENFIHADLDPDKNKNVIWTY